VPKKRLDLPGILGISHGGIRVSRVDQVFNQPQFKVWEITVKAKRVDIRYILGEFYEIWLSDYDYTMYADGKRSGTPTILYLDVNPNVYWNILVTGSKNDYTVVAYTQPNK